MHITHGMRFTRKRDGASGTILKRELAVSPLAHPGIYGKTVLTIRLDDETLRNAVGGEQTGDLGWFKSNFKILKKISK